MPFILLAITPSLPNDVPASRACIGWEEATTHAHYHLPQTFTQSYNNTYTHVQYVPPPQACLLPALPSFHWPSLLIVNAVTTVSGSARMFYHPILIPPTTLGTQLYMPYISVYKVYNSIWFVFHFNQAWIPRPLPTAIAHRE